MANYTRRLLWITMGVFLFILSAQAENPLEQVNLSPFRQWRSAWYCMQNTSKACPTKNTIKLDGVLIINGTELTDFCTNGCSQHTKDVLSCIHWVKRDFWFANGATVQNISHAISQACSIHNSSINTNYKSNAMRSYQNLLVSSVASLATLFMVSIFNI